MERGSDAADSYASDNAPKKKQIKIESKQSRERTDHLIKKYNKEKFLKMYTVYKKYFACLINK